LTWINGVGLSVHHSAVLSAMALAMRSTLPFVPELSRPGCGPAL